MGRDEVIDPNYDVSDNLSMNQSSYQGSCIILTTKHAKSIAIAPPFLDILGANIIEHMLDTDKFGTFSGEIERQDSPVECARKKCEWSLNKLGEEVEFAIASEGSFTAHPFIPFVPCDHEILYFIDRKRDFHLYLSHISEKTNYRREKLISLDEIYQFAEKVNFPSHALIIRSNNAQTKNSIFKGLCTWEAIEEAFKECVKGNKEGSVWVETDMRAQFNPSRMKVIGEIAIKLSKRLKTHCPSCDCPGWGEISYEKGLQCSSCGLETELIKSETFGCVKCDYKENRDRRDGKKEADPVNCEYCNP